VWIEGTNDKGIERKPCKNKTNNLFEFPLIAQAQQAASLKQQAWSSKPEAASSKQQAAASRSLLFGNGLVPSYAYLSTKAYKKIKENKTLNILTLDLETRKLKNNDLEVISAAIWDGEKDYTFYFMDYSSPDNLLEAVIQCLVDPKYNGWKVYVHNLSEFDGIFLFKHILNLMSRGYEVKIIKREDKFINISIIFLFYGLFKSG